MGRDAHVIDTPCIIGSRIASNGYARVPSGVGGRYLWAHRYAWERAHGPIPKGWQVHHACCVKACVNVDHLELVPSMKEHKRRHRQIAWARRQERRAS